MVQMLVEVGADHEWADVLNYPIRSFGEMSSELSEFRRVRPEALFRAVKRVTIISEIVIG
jgi:hypothetical protein